MELKTAERQTERMGKNDEEAVRRAECSWTKGGKQIYEYNG